MNLNKSTPLGHWTVRIRANPPHPSVSVREVMTELEALDRLLQEALNATTELRAQLIDRLKETTDRPAPSSAGT